MSEKHNSVIAVMGIDIGKNSFHIIGLDGRGASWFPRRRKWRRPPESRPICMPMEAAITSFDECIGKLVAEVAVGSCSLRRELHEDGQLPSMPWMLLYQRHAMWRSGGMISPNSL
jgi:hypothetical protein